MKKVALVGFGFIGMIHTKNILKHIDLKLIAIVDPNIAVIEKNLNSSVGNFQTDKIDRKDLVNIHMYSTLDDCLNSEDLDAVFICVHTSLHFEMARKALLHDKHVFIEKPLCLNIKEAEELIQLSGEKKKVLMVGHVVRFMPPYQNLKQWVDSKVFGDLKFLSLFRYSGLPVWGQWKEKSIRETSGGALFDLVIHDIDFANYILGSPSKIQCTCMPGELSKHDYINAFWSFEGDNVRVKIEGGNIFHINFPFQAGFTAQFEKVSVLYSSLRNDIIQIADNKTIKEIPAGDSSKGYYNEIAYFADCVENNTPPFDCMPYSSLQSIKLCYNHL